MFMFNYHTRNKSYYINATIVIVCLYLYVTILHQCSAAHGLVSVPVYHVCVELHICIVDGVNKLFCLIKCDMSQLCMHELQ